MFRYSRSLHRFSSMKGSDSRKKLVNEKRRNQVSGLCYHHVRTQGRFWFCGNLMYVCGWRGGRWVTVWVCTWCQLSRARKGSEQIMKSVLADWQQRVESGEITKEWREEWDSGVVWYLLVSSLYCSTQSGCTRTKYFTYYPPTYPQYSIFQLVGLKWACLWEPTCWFSPANHAKWIKHVQRPIWRLLSQGESGLELTRINKQELSLDTEIAVPGYLPTQFGTKGSPESLWWSHKKPNRTTSYCLLARAGRWITHERWENGSINKVT